MSKWHSSSESAQWKNQCLERDNWTCVLTGETEGIEVHHINHGMYFPDQRYDVSNGVAIAGWVHRMFHNDYKRNSRVKCDEKDWENFVCLFNKIEEKTKLYASRT